jgi:hypothetical protein
VQNIALSENVVPLETKILVASVRMRWAGHVARMGEERNVYEVLVWKSERNKPLED